MTGVTRDSGDLRLVRAPLPGHHDGPRGTLDYRPATRIYPRSIDLEASDGEHSASFGAANP